MLRRSALAALFLVALSACRTAAPPAARPVQTAPPQPPPAAAAEPDSIKWVRNAAEYRAAVLQTYRGATAQVETDAAGRPAGSWAVVLDADETIISNLTYQAERATAGLPYSGESWAAWVKRREATPIPGAATFLSRVRALGGKIAVVTNRLGSECDDTIAVFTRYALTYDAMLCRPNGTPSDKNARFEQVRTGAAPGIGAPVTVLAYVGDNIQDFPALAQSVKDKGDAGFADFGVRFWVLPNPMYGSWQ